MKTKRSVVAVVSAVSMAAFANFEWPDATETPEPVIPSGETVEVTDAAVIDAYTSVTIDEGATLKLATATPPTTTLKGAGSIEKVSDAVWTMTKAQTGFTGSYYLKAGVVTNAVAYTFGKGSESASAVTIYVNGGTLVIPSTAPDRFFLYEKLHIAGTGVDGMGAIVARKATTDSYSLKNGITLDDDATISCYDYFWPRGNLRLNNHTLTFAGTKTGIFYYLGYFGVKIEGPGDIRIARQGSTMRTFLFRALKSTASSAAFFVDTDPMARFILEPYTQVQIYEDDDSGMMREYTPPLKGGIHVDGGISRISHTHRRTYPDSDPHGASPVDWAGPITFKDSSSVLRLLSNGEYCELKLSGYASGPGRVQIGDGASDPAPGRYTLANPSNCYEGPTYAYLSPKASLALMYTNAVPDYVTLSCMTGRVSLLLSDTDNNWTSNAIARIANEATWIGPAVLSLDGLGLTGDNRTIDLNEWGLLSSITNSDVILGAEHGVSLIAYSPITGSTLNRFAAPPGGTVKFTGGGKIDLAYLSDRGPKGDESQFEFDGVDVTIVSNGVSVGAGTPTRMTVKDSTIIGSPTEAYDSIKTIRVGYSSGNTGVLEIDSTSFISNRITAGHSSGSVGAVYQRGGTVFNTCGTYTEGIGTYPWVGGNGHGYWEISESGKLVFMMRPIVGYSAPGILHIDGGSTVSLQRNPSSDTTQPWFYISHSKPGVVYIKDGKLDLSSVYAIIGYNVANWRATITLDGENAHYLCDSAYHVGWNTGGGGNLYINLNAGLFESSAIARRTTKVTTRTNPDIVYLNFNGGRFKSRSGTPFPEYRSDNNNYWFVASIYGGGATIDTDTNKTTINIPLKGATGNGVSAIALPAEIADRTFVAPPYIAIAGDGEGATAYAVFNSRTGKVTGVRVTSPGINYTEATASFVLGGTTLASETCTLAANTSGDFKKVGQYELILNGTNTWGGRTILAQGKLTSGVNHALPADSTYVMAGGYLNMNSKTLSDDSAYPSKWAVDLNQVRDSGTVTYAGTIDFPAGATIEVIDGDTLDDADARSMTLLRMTGTVTGEPTITGVTDPRWNASLQNGVLKLRRFTGSMFSIR